MAPATRSLRRDKVESLVDSTEAAADQLVNGNLGALKGAAELDAYYGGNEKEEMLAENSGLADSELASRKPSKVPKILRFPLVVILSLVGKGLAYSLSAAYWKGEELGRVSRRMEGWDEVGILFGWRTLELALGWFGNYDGYDLAALSLLSHGPPLYLLRTFYEVGSKTVLSSLLIDTLTTYIPFRLLRPLSAAHADSPSTPNRDITSDLPVQIITTLLAASIYSVTLYGSYMTFLPYFLATYFEGIPSLAAAYSATPTSLLPATLLLGLANTLIHLHTSHSHQALRLQSPTIRSRNCYIGRNYPVYNLWGWSKKTKIVIKRTATLMIVTGINTFVQTYLTVEGVEALGAVAYSGVWVVAAGICGVSWDLWARFR
ncbi:hypothetical protein DID88_000364 [Monilinia fructigena]|uniref:Uncharacterized protein n=1 Tax=Monilinia fructigena TaxID=38457 RepID=A0A395IHC7_9HELO|nr:hypothetical protein DID88_000364 [Monilinia fructigena]